MNTLATAILESAEEAGLDLHPDYSGRFMYGAECIGVSGSTWALTDWWANLPLDQRGELGKPRTDSMGLGTIWYWPGVTA